MDEIYKLYLTLPPLDAADLYLKHMQNWSFKDLNKHYYGSTASYHYMLTLTLSPTLHPNPDLIIEEVEQYIVSIGRRATALHLTNVEYAQELHKDGRPHWHILLSSEKPIKKNRFQYCSQKFGHLDFSRSKGQTNDNILNYISKDTLPIKVPLSA